MWLLCVGVRVPSLAPLKIMSKKITYHAQCVLKKENTLRTSWIPEKYAIKGKIVGLKTDGIWSEGWEIRTVSSNRLPSSTMKFIRDEHMHHRSVTDI